MYNNELQKLSFYSIQQREKKGVAVSFKSKDICYKSIIWEFSQEEIYRHIQ